MTPQTADSHMQEKVFAFLADPVAHPEVRRIDTHAASVFLESDRVLKIKRAVHFPYLDYSTLAKRKAACEEEIKVSRRFAPQIYRRVVAITQRPDGSLNIDGDGTPVEFAVEMARFDERQTMDRLAEAAPPDLDLVCAIADAIAASHAVAAPALAAPWIESILPMIADNTEAFRAAACFPTTEIDRIDEASRSTFSAVRSLLERRGALGFVRRCHGDLHLANIVLIEGKPVLFDAIEFDTLIASVDVLYDLAFPMMDFIQRERRAAANSLFNRYLSTTPGDNINALAALPLFMSLRAAIRAKVLLDRIGQAPNDKAVAMQQQTRSYFELAHRVIHPSAPTLVAVGGLSGTGKSVLARALAPDVMPQPGAVVFRTDLLRKELFKVREGNRLPESAYRPEITEKVYEMIAKRAERILSQGHSVVVDAVFARESERAGINDVAKRLSIRLVGLFLVTDLATRLARVSRRKNDASDATPEIARLQDKYDLGAIDWTVIDASGTPEQTLKRCQTHFANGPKPARA
jgi:aminoglycoside phosphotransferase family enzyme/predicted kinase